MPGTPPITSHQTDPGPVGRGLTVHKVGCQFRFLEDTVSQRVCPPYHHLEGSASIAFLLASPQLLTHFQIRMAEILQDIEGAVCLMGNVLVHGKSQEEHDRQLMVALQKLQEAGLTLNQKKCEFSKSRVKLLP